MRVSELVRVRSSSKRKGSIRACGPARLRGADRGNLADLSRSEGSLAGSSRNMVGTPPILPWLGLVSPRGSEQRKRQKRVEEETEPDAAPTGHT